MQYELTKCQQLLTDKYLDGVKSKKDEMMFLSVGMGANSFGFEEKIIDYLNLHPKATLQELDQYAKQFFPELVIEDDEDEVD